MPSDLFETLQAERRNYLRILQGEKLEVEAGDYRHTLFETLHAGGRCAYIPQELLACGEHTPSGVSTHHAYSEPQATLNLDIRERLSDAGYEKIRVVGRYPRTAKEEKLETLLERADGFVVPEKGDIYTIYELLWLMELRLAARETQDETLSSNKSEAPIILEGDGAFYQPVFDAIGINGAQLAHLGIQCSDSPAHTEALLKLADVSPAPGTLFSNEEAIHYEKNKGFFLGTTSTVKYAEAVTALREYDFPLCFLSALTNDPFPDADEYHQTLNGNAVGLLDDLENNSGKLATLLEKLHDYRPEDLREQLEARGLRTDRFVVMTEDRGGYFPPEIMKHFDYDNTETIKRRSYAPLPFEEIKPFVKAKGGIVPFFDAMNEAAEKADAEAGERAPRIMRGNSVIALAEISLNPDGSAHAFDWEAVKVQTFHGHEHSEFIDSPRPPGAGLMRIEHFKIPFGEKHSRK